ncbi:MAG: M3 family oligoendopeptidase [Bacillota bacterium]
MPRPYGQKWNLDVFFPGGSVSPQFASHLESLTAGLAALRTRIGGLAAPGIDAAGEDAFGVWHSAVEAIQEVASSLQQASSFATCLTAQDVTDEQARLLVARLSRLQADFSTILTDFDRRLLAFPEPVWRAMLEDDRFRPVAFALDEQRRRAAEKLPPDLEVLVTDLAVDGYYAWGDLYELVAGRITIPVEEDGRTVHLSAGQAANRLQTADRAARSRLFALWEQAWGAQADLLASALNHLAGYRLSVYRHRGWESVLKEPLDVNRISQATLDAMWSAVEEGKERLVPYLRRKAELLGVEALSWHDVTAPLPASEGQPDQRIPFDEAAEFIVDHFARFSPDMASLAGQAFEEGWVEAEDRPGKRPGGFCTTFPLSRQSRIFTTYGGTSDSVRTLAHELGHAYHSHVMRDLPVLARRYPMSLAETASTFAELIVHDASMAHAADERERLELLEQKLQRAVTFFMNIHARFLFEEAFYEARRKGPLGVADLNALMLEAQKAAYRGLLGQYHPLFWASKLHFYLTRTPFYNFPYTVGFLFSSGIYARARAEGRRFADRYVALLKDSGSMTVEDLARRHLGADLTRTGFWHEAVEEALAGVDDFLRATG